MRDDFLVKIARFRRSHALYSTCLLLGGVVRVMGVVLILCTLHRVLTVHGWPPALDELVLGLLGLVVILAGVFIHFFLCLSRVAHEVLLSTDDDYKGTYETDTKDRQDRVGLSTKPVSTRDLSIGWRALVIITLVIGGLLMVLSIWASQVPNIENLVLKRGMRWEALCIVGLMLLMIGAILMAFGGAIGRRASKHKW